MVLHNGFNKLANLLCSVPDARCNCPWLLLCLHACPIDDDRDLAELK